VHLLFPFPLLLLFEFGFVFLVECRLLVPFASFSLEGFFQGTSLGEVFVVPSFKLTFV
jgi:hypothetical protein